MTSTKTALLFLCLAIELSAHPMGNFSVNHYSRLYFREGGVELTYVLDLAEIPTFEVLGQWRIDGNDRTKLVAKSTEEAKTWLGNLVIVRGGRTVPLHLKTVSPATVDGAGGMPVLRLPAHVVAQTKLASYSRVAYHEFVTGHAGKALVWMATAVEAGSPAGENLAWCLVEFGDMLFKSGRTADARAAYQRAIETLPGCHRAYAALGREFAAAGEYEKAVESFRRAQAVIPLPEYAASLERLYTELDRQPEAERQRNLIDVIDKLEKANGEKGNRALAVVYADENRNLDRALELVRGELDTRKDVYTFDALSWVLFRSGRLKEAEEASARAPAFQTPEPAFLYHAGLIALAEGRVDAGKDLLRQALALNPAFAFPYARDAKRRLAGLAPWGSQSWLQPPFRRLMSSR